MTPADSAATESHCTCLTTGPETCPLPSLAEVQGILAGVQDELAVPNNDEVVVTFTRTSWLACRRMLYSLVKPHSEAR